MHPLSPFSSNTNFQLKSDLHWSQGKLDLQFELRGPLDRLQGLISCEGPQSNSTEGLWQSTCFEAFFGPSGKSFYYEINLSADGRWMVFRFQSERTDRRMLDELKPIRFTSILNRDVFTLSASFDLSAIGELKGQILSAVPAVVLQETDSKLSYWSMKHSGAKPDFHAAAHRVLTLKT